MALTMTTTKIPSEEDRADVKHAREVDALKAQCEECKLNKPKTPTKDCDVKIKLVVKDSEIGWKHRHLFLNGDKCKMFKSRKEESVW